MFQWQKCQKRNDERSSFSVARCQSAMTKVQVALFLMAKMSECKNKITKYNNTDIAQ